MRLTLSLILVGTLSAAALACGSPSGSDASSTDDALSGKCVDVLTLTCKSGYEPSEVGCLQSHVEGAAPLGKCVKVEADAGDPTSEVCVDTDLACAAGYESTEVGCLQSHVAGAHPFAKCVKSAVTTPTEDACVDVTTLDCKSGYEVSEDGCFQSHVEGANPYGRCVKSAVDTDAGTDAGSDDACVDILTLTCEDGYEPSEDGCLQSHVEGADPYGHCVKSP